MKTIFRLKIVLLALMAFWFSPFGAQAGIGVLHVTGDFTFTGGMVYVWEIKDVDSGGGVGWDLIEVDGTVDFTSTPSDKWQLSIQSLTPSEAHGDVHDFGNTASYSWPILRTQNGIVGFSASTVDIDISPFSNPLAGDFALEQVGKDLHLRYAPNPSVPDLSSTFLLLAFSLSAVGLSVRMTRRSPIPI